MKTNSWSGLIFAAIGVVFLLLSMETLAQQSTVKIALLKYDGGGDWYSDPTALKNLASFCNKELKTNIDLELGTVEPGSVDLFNYCYIEVTGHGNIVLSKNDAESLRTYMESGGFLHIDDNYGFDIYIRREMKKVFPDLDFVELPTSHEIYHQHFDFPEGLPKIHEHDGKRPQGFGLIYKGRLVCFYSYESDLGDGWEDQSVHNDTPEVRQKALQMGANIVSYVFNQ